VIFEPQAALGNVRDTRRVVLQCYRREADGGFVRVYAGTGPFTSLDLTAFVVVATEGSVARLRVRDPRAMIECSPPLRVATLS
jgi:hypothetical protein